MKNHPKERGQALIIIAFAAVGLFAFTALAIDGGAAFSKDRQAQNAADAAALAGALALTRATDAAAGHTAALAAADASTKGNNFNNDGTTNVVTIYNPPVDGPYAGDANYVQVKILAHVTTYFTRIIGREKVDVGAEAIARTTGPTVEPWHLGDALVSLMPGCKSPGQSDDPFVVSGGANINVNGSGIRVNSDCTKNAHEAFSQGGNSSVTVDTSVCVYGAASYNNVSPAPDTGCPPSDNSQYQLPNPVCKHDGFIADLGGGEYMAVPGNYSVPFPDVSPAGKLYLQKGIYCLHDGFDLHSHWNVTSDLNDDGVHDSLSEGVFFFVDGGDITFNGTSDINIHAVDTNDQDFPDEFVNMLIYVPPSNRANIKLTGNNGSLFTGTILAPTSSTEILGSNNSVAYHSQIISYTVKASGGGTIDITYNQDENNVTPTNPTVTLVK
jgi:Flp pilus assembly protein TadG